MTKEIRKYLCNYRSLLRSLLEADGSEVDIVTVKIEEVEGRIAELNKVLRP